ncbi:anti-sigma factor [Chryseobacterium caseinilyticum]|uniref:Anti-sigma factor n=1 Tax=Chryseobacterium caseinilyticum TaxID=2771428 RepID=A0ABR8ZC72_9FLAO|nr:anti-sigma factor [Chryseobacterium caseinilyticum]MBD8082361.1 anti-sigma factor [Chryseobacterium caseinilyticum]
MNTQEYISSGILEAYILGTATQEESGILECVMSHNAQVREAFEETQKILEDLATAQAVKPADELKDKIWLKISQTEKEVIPLSVDNQQTKTIPLPAELHIESDATSKSLWSKLSVAASVLLVISLGANLFWMTKSSEKDDQIIAMRNQQNDTDKKIKNINDKLGLITNPDLQKIVLAGVETHPDSKAVVFWDKTNTKVYLNVQNLPDAPSGKQYQLWAIADGKPVSAGMYTKDKDTRIALSEIPKAQAFAITLEQEGGSAAPTMENMYVMGTVL